MPDDRYMQEAHQLMQSAKFNANWLARQEAIAEVIEAAEERGRDSARIASADRQAARPGKPQ